MRATFPRFLTAAPCAAALLMSGCAAQSSGVNLPSPTTGFSGMAKIDDTHYLAVHDEKSHESGVRISILEGSAEQGITVIPTEPASWEHSEGRSNDLEGVCSLPGRDEEFLLVEAGHWEGDFGRLFHVKVDITTVPYEVSVLHAFDLPEFDPKGPQDRDGDEIEGLACAARQDGSTLVIFGERGGSSVYPNGLLRWAVIDLNAKTGPRFSAAGRAGKAVYAPVSKDSPASNRDISALHLDADNNLWAVATEDPGDFGPFRSVIYKAGEVRADDPDPIRIENPSSASRSVDGFKIESLAAPTTQIEGSVFAIGTEDEALGGVWRAIR